ncbi:MAG: succinate dehydrogenase, hydrophobic membrane anchor protein [Pseudomonadota bacterium]
MRFLTDRKRAVGMGSAKSGVEHFISMKISAVGLLILTPLFLLTFGPQLGEPYDEVLAHFARPYPALITGLMIAVGFMHFKNGVQVLIEDYTHGPMKDALIVGTICLSYAAATAGIFAVAKLAL